MAGERRLRAARIAGLREVPCLVAQVGEEDSALLALMENLQRRDLDCWEEAQAIARLISRYGLSQEEAARRLGHRAIHALSLPAACAPETAGEAVAQTVCEMIGQREEA